MYWWWCWWLVKDEKHWQHRRSRGCDVPSVSLKDHNPRWYFFLVVWEATVLSSSVIVVSTRSCNSRSNRLTCYRLSLLLGKHLSLPTSWQCVKVFHWMGMKICCNEAISRKLVSSGFVSVHSTCTQNTVELRTKTVESISILVHAQCCCLNTCSFPTLVHFGYVATVLRTHTHNLISHCESLESRLRRGEYWTLT